MEKVAGLSKFELDRSARLLLPNACTIGRIAAWRDIVDFQRYDIAATKLAVDGNVKQRQIARPAFDL
jgi:hypothetical protein